MKRIEIGDAWIVLALKATGSISAAARLLDVNRITFMRRLREIQARETETAERVKEVNREDAA
jgi:transcriptional regulator of acetoin/glycerol metabolism